MPSARWKSQAQLRHYLANKDKIVARARAHGAKTRATVQAWLMNYLRAHPCVDCGEADLVVLEFDHRDRTQKRFNIGEAWQARYGLRTVIEEVQKCDVRCANCHRRKTFSQLGWLTRTPPSA